MPRVFDVRQFGAMGDGDTDDTHSVQSAIDAASQVEGTIDPWGKGGIVAFPAGQFRIRKTLLAKQQAGIQFVGSGTTWTDERGNANVRGPRTSLFWDPDGADSILLRLQGCHAVTVSDMGLYGARTHTPESTPPVKLIQVEHVDLWGAGIMTFRNLLLVDAEWGIRVGDPLISENTCDTMILERVVMEQLTEGYIAEVGQSVAHLINMLRATEYANVVKMAKGGVISVNNAEIKDCGATGVDPRYAFEFPEGGPNLRASRLTCVRIQGTQNFLRIDGDHRVAIDSFTEAQKLGEGAAIVNLKGGAATFHASSFQTLPVLTWEADGSRRSTVRFRDCWFDVEPDEDGTVDPGNIIDSPTETDCFYSFERCDGQNNVPFKDMKTEW